MRQPSLREANPAFFLLIFVALLLTACGGSRENLAIAACERAIASRITDKQFQIDRADMAANARAEADEVIRIQSKIVFDPGLPREETQTFDCRVRFSADKREPDVISLSFVW
jgi:hypothetical protein